MDLELDLELDLDLDLDLDLHLDLDSKTLIIAERGWNSLNFPMIIARRG